MRKQICPILSNTHGRNQIDRVIPAVREAIEGGNLDFTGELTSLNFNDWTSSTAIRMILMMFEHHSEWKESRQFYSRVTEWIVAILIRDHKDSSEHLRRDYALEHDALQSIAGFVLKPSDRSGSVYLPSID